MAALKTLSLKSEHDGLTLSLAEILPDGGPKGLVQISHGMAEHKERYYPLMEALAQHGYACIINDHRGHGRSVRSGQDLGYFYDDGANGLIRDLKQVSDLFRADHPGLPLFLIGHSMGALAARAYAARYGESLAGLVLSGNPGENAAAAAGLLLTRISALVHGGGRGKSRLLDNMISGGFSKPFPGGSPFAWLSANGENVSAYEADPLCGFPFTVNGYQALLKLMLAAYDRRSPMPGELPVHCMSGENDPCAPDRKGFDAAVQNLRDRGSRNVTSIMYPGLRHEIFNERVPQVISDLIGRLDSWL